MSVDRNDLVRRIREAAELAKEVPEALREAAFRAAFDELSRVGQEAPRPTARRRTSGRRASTPPVSTAPSARAKRSTASGPKTMVRQLVVEGFLDDPKNVPEIRDHLASAKGRHFQPKAIHTAVLRLLRDNEIVRASGDDGYRYSRRR